MTRIGLAVLIGASVLTGGAAFAAEARRKVEIVTTADKAWAVIGDFCGISTWHPAVASCELSKRDGQTIRTVKTKDGGTFVEKLIAWDDKATTYSYEVLESPLPVTKLVATLKVQPDDDDDDEVQVIWSAEFTAKGMGDAEARDRIEATVYPGLKAIQKRLNTE